MRCSIQGCPGEYEERLIVHAVEHRGRVLVFDHVPAEVCSICGDTLLTPETPPYQSQYLGSHELREDARALTAGPSNEPPRMTR